MSPEAPLVFHRGEAISSKTYVFGRASPELTSVGLLVQRLLNVSTISINYVTNQLETEQRIFMILLLQSID